MGTRDKPAASSLALLTLTPVDRRSIVVAVERALVFKAFCEYSADVLVVTTRDMDSL